MSKTVYLDFANWIDLARGNVDKTKFEKAVSKGLITPVLSFTHLLETANSGRSWLDVARYFDHINSIKPIRWLQGLMTVMKLEAKTCYESWLSGNTIKVSPFGDTLVDVLEHRHLISWVNTLEARTYTIQQTVDILKRSPTLREYRITRQSYPSWRQRLSKNRYLYRQPRFSLNEKSHWLINLLPTIIELSNGLLYPVTFESKENFGEAIDFSLCPAFVTKLAFDEGLTLDPEGTLASAIDDTFHLVGVAYSNVAFVDKQTLDILRKGHLKHLPCKNAYFLEWLKDL